MYILPRHFFFGFPMKLLTIIGISFLTANHAAAEVNTPQAVKALVSGLEEADFTNITVTSRELVRIFLEQLWFEFVPVFHGLQGRFAAQD